MNLQVVKAICGVFIGCMINIITLEFLVKNDPSVGSLVTFLQFIFISIYGVIFVSKFFTNPTRIPKIAYLKIVIYFFLVNVFNNMAFNYKIPVPLHLIFRSGSLITNMILSAWLLQRSYPLFKYVAVIMITLGITICTLLSSEDGNDSAPDNFFWWIIGITLLTVALILSSILGVEQEKLSTKYGKHPMEAMFYTHLFSLPGFITVYRDIIKYIGVTMPGEQLQLWFINISMQWIYLIGNCISQFLCISSVYKLTTESTSLTVTLVITLRKFASLLVSIMYFKNPFTIGHWIGTILVFGGTIWFTEVVPKIIERLQSKVVTKKRD